MFAKTDGGGYHSPIDGIEQKTLVHGAKTLMAEFRLRRGSVLPLHRHPHEQTGYLISGRMRLYVDGQAHECEAGDSWCIAGDVEHSAEIIEDAVAIEVFAPVRQEYVPRD